MNRSTRLSRRQHQEEEGYVAVNAHAVLPLPSYFSVTQDEMEKRFGIYKGHNDNNNIMCKACYQRHRLNVQGLLTAPPACARPATTGTACTTGLAPYWVS